MSYVIDGESYVWQDEPAPEGAPPAADNSLEGVLGRYNESNFDISGAAKVMRTLGAQYGLTDEDLVAAVPTFGDLHRQRFNSGYTEASNYNQIAQSAVQDALKAKGQNPDAASNQNFIDAGASAANQRWEATQEDDSGGLFGDLGIIAQLAALIPGPQQPFLLAANAVNNVSKGNLIGAALNAFGAYSSFGTAADAASFSAENSFDSGAMSDVLNRGGELPIGTGDPNVFADAGTTMNDGTPAGPDTTATPSAENYAEAYPGSGVEAQTQPPAPFEDRGRIYRPPGLIEEYLNPVANWANQNPGAARLGGGALTLAGGIGAALLNRSTSDRRLEAEKEMLSQRTAELSKVDENKRALIQLGSYFDSKGLPTAPASAPRKMLRRPDGSLVFAQPGIVAGQMVKPR